MNFHDDDDDREPRSPLKRAISHLRADVALPLDLIAELQEKGVDIAALERTYGN